MSQTHGVLDYARPATRTTSRFWRGALSLVILYALFTFGAALGRLASHLIIRQKFIAEGTTFVRAAQVSPGLRYVGLPQTQKLTIVSAAVQAANKDRAGKSLPISTAFALAHSQFAYYPSPAQVKVTYEDSDAKTADCMVRSLINAYVNAQSAAWGTTPRTAFVPGIAMGTRPVPTIMLDNLSSLAGSILGVAIFLVWPANRRKRSNWTIQTEYVVSDEP